MFFCCWVRTWRGLWRRAGSLSSRGLTNKFTWLLGSRSRIKHFLSTFHRFEPNGLLIPYLWAAGGPTRWEQQFRQGSSACKRFRKPLLCASIARWKVLYELNISAQKLLECFRNWKIVVISSFGSWREKNLSWYQPISRQNKSCQSFTETHLLDLNKVWHVKTHQAKSEEDLRSRCNLPCLKTLHLVLNVRVYDFSKN